MEYTLAHYEPTYTLDIGEPMQTEEYDPYKDMRPAPGLDVVGYRRNGPNIPCACGSGKKQKKCCPQGAPVYGVPLPKPAGGARLKPADTLRGTMGLLPALMLLGGPMHNYRGPR